MKFVKTLLLLVCILALLCPVALANGDNQNLNTITVQGSGHLEVSPDQAKISISVITTAPSAADAKNENARKSAQVQKKLVSMGIAADKISTERFSVSPVYSSNEKQTRITSYEVNNTIAVKAEDLSAVGSIIDGALSAGANQISGIRFSRKNEIGLKQTVLKDAVKEATSKANAIAEAMGKRLGRIVSVSENGTSVGTFDNQRVYMAKANFEAADTNITPGPIQVNGTISMVFEIQ